MIEDIKRHLENNCPVLLEKKLNVNCLGEKAGSVIIKTLPHKEVIKKYADGGTLKQYLFEICLRTSFDADFNENTQIAVFMENLKNWFLDKKSVEKITLSDKNCIPIEFEVVKTHGISNRDRSGAQHTVMVRFIYEQEVV